MLLASLLPLLIGLGAGLYAKSKEQKAPTIPSLPTSVSDEVLAERKKFRRQVAEQRGKQSTIVTGGLATTPTLSMPTLMGM